jgi:IS30 family transposase
VAQNGCALSTAEVGKIVSLLSSTDMSIDQIAKRMGCCHSTVKKINKMFLVRDYAGQRSTWRTYEHDQKKIA